MELEAVMLFYLLGQKMPEQKALVALGNSSESDPTIGYNAQIKRWFERAAHLTRGGHGSSACTVMCGRAAGETLNP